MRNWKGKLFAILLISAVCLIIHVFNPVHRQALEEKRSDRSKSLDRMSNSRSNNSESENGRNNTTDSEHNIGMMQTTATKYFGNGATATRVDTLWIDIADISGQVVGRAVSSEVVGDDIIGYGGNTPVLIVVDNDGKIKGVELLENAESSNFVNRIKESDFFDLWNGKTLAESATFSPDAISGATITSIAVVQNVNKAAQKATAIEVVDAFNWYDLLKSVVASLLIICAIIICFRPAKFMKYRTWLMLASIIILGVWLGEFLSIQMFYRWITGGIVFRYTIFVLFCVSIILPLFFSKPIYCTYLCPFGASQELVGKITKRKIKISEGASFYLGLIKKLYLVFLIVLALSSSTIDFTNFEPFTVFIYQSVSTVVIILASVILFLSLFINRPWCRYACPTGFILSLLHKGVKK